MKYIITALILLVAGYLVWIIWASDLNVTPWKTHTGDIDYIIIEGNTFVEEPADIIADELNDTITLMEMGYQERGK